MEGFPHSPHEMAGTEASADALDDDWWLVSEEEGRGKKRRGSVEKDASELISNLTKKRKRRPKLEDVRTEQV